MSGNLGFVIRLGFHFVGCLGCFVFICSFSWCAVKFIPTLKWGGTSSFGSCEAELMYCILMDVSRTSHVLSTSLFEGRSWEVSVSVVFGHVEFVWFDGSLEDFLACALSGFISFGSG